MTNKVQLTREVNEYEFVYHEKPATKTSILLSTGVLFMMFIVSLFFCL